MKQILSASLIAAAACFAQSCQGLEPNFPQTPTPPSVSDTFSGTVEQKGASVHTFTVSTTGTVGVNVTTVGPLSTMALGVSVGAWNAGSCAVGNIRNDNARAGALALNGTALAGEYCVRVFDSGNLPEGGVATYTVVVTHP